MFFNSNWSSNVTFTHCPKINSFNHEIENIIYFFSLEIHFSPAVNFINVKSTNFLYECCFLKLHLAWRQKFVRKMHAKNVDEIDTRSQFHQHFVLGFFVRNFGNKNYKAEN